MEIVENELAGGSFGDADRCSLDWVQVAMGFVPEIRGHEMFHDDMIMCANINDQQPFIAMITRSSP